MKQIDAISLLDKIKDPELRERAASLLAVMERNPRTEPQEEPPPAVTAKVIQLPLWPEPRRGCRILRCAGRCSPPFRARTDST